MNSKRRIQREKTIRRFGYFRKSGCIFLKVANMRKEVKITLLFHLRSVSNASSKLEEKIRKTQLQPRKRNDGHREQSQRHQLQPVVPAYDEDLNSHKI